MIFLIIIDYNISNNCEDFIRSCSISVEEESPSVLHRSYTTGDLNDVYVSLRAFSGAVIPSLGEKGRTPPYGLYLPSPVCKYEEGEGSSSSPERPTAVHRIVFRCYLSSRSGITLPRWYTMTFISGFARLGPRASLSCPRESFVNDPFVARATRTCVRLDSREINVQRRHFLKNILSP